ETGTSFADSLTALFVLGGLLLMVGAPDQRAVWPILAGATFGAAAALKLTNAVFVVGYVAAVCITKDRLRNLGLAALGIFAGYMLFGAQWAFHLWSNYGSPIYPFYNEVFRSPDAELVNFSDGRFFPNGLGEALSYPYLWLVGQQKTAE